MLEEDVARDRFVMEDGALVVPQGPGLGVDVDESRLAAYREGEIESFES
jgi:L-alanine-DL-glutamate epimerase-like enolase superfamily enzyme